ncbi:hypothetical protein SLEP1_g43559 [Rubroshorea leprosula]|uniref:Uncharacterized protein n=1 Tax=Rubroshorea leprosula TaxID=152421 RepID=A0AAV5LDB7_9ROSI|nr:hypothetical protein SLEP1_g43559 [Rubroshorea leprosula]
MLHNWGLLPSEGQWICFGVTGLEQPLTRQNSAGLSCWFIGW